MGSIAFAVQASRDLEEIEEYISKDNPDAAARLIVRIRDKCALLAQHPSAGDDRSDVRPALRGFPVGNDVIFYKMRADGIDVIRVLHGARDIPRLFE